MRTLHTLMQIAHHYGRITDAELAEGEKEPVVFWRGGERPPPRPPGSRATPIRRRHGGRDHCAAARPRPVASSRRAASLARGRARSAAKKRRSRSLHALFEHALDDLEAVVQARVAPNRVERRDGARLGIAQPYTTRATRASTRAPAHIAHGSSVT